MNNETDVERCKSLIEASLGWGDAASWTNEDFDELSDRIFAGTSVRLSVSTLKRIWGKVKYDHSPTTATLNTLARYAGFESWRDFLSRHEPPPVAMQPAPREAPEPSQPTAPDPPPLVVAPFSHPSSSAPSCWPDW